MNYDSTHLVYYTFQYTLCNIIHFSVSNILIKTSRHLSAELELKQHVAATEHWPINQTTGYHTLDHSSLLSKHSLGEGKAGNLRAHMQNTLAKYCGLKCFRRRMTQMPTEKQCW